MVSTTLPLVPSSETNRREPRSTVHARALADAAAALASHRDVASLLSTLAFRLNPIVGCEGLVVALLDEATGDILVHDIGGVDDTHRPPPGLFPRADGPTAEVIDRQQPYFIADTEREERYPRVAALVRAHGMRSYWSFPLTTPRRRMGCLSFAGPEPGVPSAEDTPLLLQVAHLVAAAIENAESHERARRLQEELKAERDALGLLLEVNNAIVAHLDLDDLTAAIAGALSRALGYELTCITLYDEAGPGRLRIAALHSQVPLARVCESLTIPIEGSPSGTAFSTRRPFVLGSLAEARALRLDEIVVRLIEEEGFRADCAVPLVSRDRVLGTLDAASRKEGVFDARAVALMTRVAAQIAPAVDNALAYREIARLKERLEEKARYLEAELRAGTSDMVGEGPSVRAVKEAIATVAPTGSTVLVTGETGTGKEVAARAIHRLSDRREKPFIKINCAAIPTGLLESELFGHEKGAFTGAVAQKVGRFELADGGTLFLDEVGDIPAELQPKLLRVLQEREFERLGGTRTIKVDVRLVAATNRDLAAMVQERAFRSDLFYRLNVFPIPLPPLRERPEDVPALVRAFVERMARRLGRRAPEVTPEAMDALVRYPWPGNIRELENLVERALILTRGDALAVPLAELARAAAEAPPPETPAREAHTGASAGTGKGKGKGASAKDTGVAEAGKPLEAAERAAIVAALEASRWVVGGKAGAAARLGISRTTLQAKMQRLGVVKPG